MLDSVSGVLHEIWYEDSVVFDNTTFYVILPEQKAIFEHDAILVHFVVLEPTVCC